MAKAALMGRRAQGACSVALVLLLLSSGLAAAAPGPDDAGKPKLPAGTPLPPARPASLQPQTPAPASPSTPPAPPSAPATASVAPEPPRPLPPASRARMHECGVEWQQMKATGAATDKTWRAFAQICLVR